MQSSLSAHPRRSKPSRPLPKPHSCVGCDRVGVESSSFQVTVVPTETVSVIGVNMKLLISTVDPPTTVAEGQK